MPKAGGARLRHGLGDFPGNATLKVDFVFWVKALPSRATPPSSSALNGAALRPIWPSPSFADTERWATARQLCGPAYYRFDNFGSPARPEGKFRSLAPPKMSASEPPLLRMTLIGKRFPGVQALDDAGLEVLPGEIHALLGENGAGKSTLIKILSGAQQPDSGTIEFGGESVTMASPHDAQRRGIVTIYQEFTLAPNMTIAENVFIGREPGPSVFVDWPKMAAETRAITTQLGLQLRPMSIVRKLNVAEQQMVEIARALSMKSRLIVMDEPTSALSSARSISSFGSSAISRRTASALFSLPIASKR